MGYGSTIRHLREVAGISQKALAEKLGMPVPRLCERESGNVQMHPEEYHRAHLAILEIRRERDAAFEDAMKAATA